MESRSSCSGVIRILPRHSEMPSSGPQGIRSPLNTSKERKSVRGWERGGQGRKPIRLSHVLPHKEACRPRKGGGDRAGAWLDLAERKFHFLWTKQRLQPCVFPTLPRTILRCPEAPWHLQSGAAVGRPGGLELGVEEKWADWGARGMGECFFDTGYWHGLDHSTGSE